jgi:hypothetical protein
MRVRSTRGSDGTSQQTESASLVPLVKVKGGQSATWLTEAVLLAAIVTSAQNIPTHVLTAQLPLATSGEGAKR